MKRLLLFTVFSIFIIIFQSCWNVHYRITDIRFGLAEIEENKYTDKSVSYNCTSVVKDKLIFIISHYEEYVSQYMYNELGSACYAFTKGRTIDNPLLEESFSLKLNKTFLYEGREIPKETNIFSVEEIYKEVDIYKTYNSFCGMGADKVLDFSDEFFKRAVFQKDEYKVSFSCRTCEGQVFNKTIIINFE